MGEGGGSRNASVVLAALTLATLALAVGCGTDDGSSDQRLIESASLTPESLEDAGVALNEPQMRRLVANSCSRSPEVCRCFADGVLSQVSPSEFSLLTIQGPAGKRAATLVGEKAAEACATGRPSPDAPPDEASSILAEPVTVTPQSIEKLDLLSEEQGEAAYMKKCSMAGSVSTCACTYSALRDELSLSEIVLLAFQGPEAMLESSFAADAVEACEDV